MTCCCATKRDPDRTCTTCFKTQEWITPIPPGRIIAISASLDVINDATDANNNDCDLATLFGSAGTQNGSGLDSHTYLPTYGKNDPDAVGTEIGDSLFRPVLDTDTNISRQIVSNRIYATSVIIWREFPRPVSINSNAFGYFWIPPNAILDSSYTKRYQATVGCDYHGDTGPLVTLNSIGTGNKEGTQLAEFEMSFTNKATLRFPFNNLGRKDRPENNVNLVNTYSDEFKDEELADIPVLLSIGIFPNDRTIDTGMKFGDYSAVGATVRIDVEIVSVNRIADGRWSVTTQATYTVLSNGAKLIENVTQDFVRCMYGKAVVNSIGHAEVFETDSGKLAIDFPPSSTHYRLSSANATWWTDKFILASGWCAFSMPWIGDFRLTNGTFADEAFFRVSRFVQKRFDGTTVKTFSADDFDDDTIPDGTVLDIDAEVNDSFEMDLDNFGDATTEVSSITFETPLITAVDESAPTLNPFEVEKITFDGPTVIGGGAPCSPASSASITPSPLAEVSDSPAIYNPSIPMTYNGTGNTWSTGSATVTLNNYNGNTGYDVSVQVQVVRGGENVANLSHDIAFDFGLSDTDSGSTVDDAATTIDSTVSTGTTIVPTGSAMTPSQVDPSPYAPEFGDIIRWTWTFTGNSDGIDYVRVLEGTIDCTFTDGGGGGEVDSDIVITHDQGGSNIPSPYTLTLRSVSGIN